MGDDIRKSNFSSYLFAEKSFVSGYGRILDVSGSYKKYNSSLTAEEADKKSLTNDWRAIGQDIKHSMSSYAKKQGIK
jgi:hypothetical protein